MRLSWGPSTHTNKPSVPCAPATLVHGEQRQKDLWGMWASSLSEKTQDSSRRLRERPPQKEWIDRIGLKRTPETFFRPQHVYTHTHALRHIHMQINKSSTLSKTETTLKWRPLSKYLLGVAWPTAAQIQPFLRQEVWNTSHLMMTWPIIANF